MDNSVKLIPSHSAQQCIPSPRTQPSGQILSPMVISICNVMTLRMRKLLLHERKCVTMHELSKQAGRNFAHLLRSRHISQQQFASIVDRTPRTVRRWMYEGIPSLDDLQLIAEALSVGAGDILSENEDVPFYRKNHVLFCRFWCTGCRYHAIILSKNV